MYLLYCDETNFEKSPGDFFLYGGLIIPPDRAASLASSIATIRSQLGVPREYILKFNPGPAGFTHQQFILLKQQIIETAVAHGCHLLVSALLHDIAVSSEETRRFGINTLCYHFDCYLNRKQAPGVVLIDRFDDREIDNQLRERLAVGLTGRLPYSSEKAIENIVGYHFTAIGTSHFCSLVDVVIGSLRFAINVHTRGNDAHFQSMSSILNLLAPLFFSESPGKVSEISLALRPKEVRNGAYREKYQGLVAMLAEHNIVPAQPV